MYLDSENPQKDCLTSSIRTEERVQFDPNTLSHIEKKVTRSMHSKVTVTLGFVSSLPLQISLPCHIYAHGISYHTFSQFIISRSIVTLPSKTVV